MHVWDRGSTASVATEAHEVRVRVERLRSLIRWTAPLYVILLSGGLFASHFAFAMPLLLLLAILVAFAVVDVAVLTRIHRIEVAPIRTDRDLSVTRQQIDRLARTVLYAGAGLGLAFLAVFVLLMLSA
ncbi:MAG: hypothetical protein L3J78_04600 [Thermoplasmata archaeon]|nr:hypothetical protein [Thermoplasmata archaeon]